ADGLTNPHRLDGQDPDWTPWRPGEQQEEQPPGEGQTPAGDGPETVVLDKDTHRLDDRPVDSTPWLIEKQPPRPGEPGAPPATIDTLASGEHETPTGDEGPTVRELTNPHALHEGPVDPERLGPWRIEEREPAPGNTGARPKTRNS